MKNGTDRQPFAFKDCTLAAIATGKRAQNLRELRNHLQNVDAGCIYYHFWGGRLRPQFDEPEYNNDFAAWCRHALRDDIVAERLSVVDPTAHKSMEDLRSEVIEILEERLDEREFIPWAKTEEQFTFIRSQIVVFSTPHRISTPTELPGIITRLSTSSIFYHFIDARRRTPERKDDFSTWLEGLNGENDALLARLADVDPYFVTLSDLRGQLAALFNEYWAHENNDGRN